MYGRTGRTEPEVLVVITGAVIGAAVLVCACTVFFLLRRRGSGRG
ncbi:hypothetical protein [Streptomyces qinzhouensis]|nr:hypothetical protein [Streptomyces qinzhouensis]